MTRRWVQLVIGAWVMLSPWLLGFSGISVMKWSNVICGLALVVLNAWMLSESHLAKEMRGEESKNDKRSS